MSSYFISIFVLALGHCKARYADSYPNYVPDPNVDTSDTVSEWKIDMDRSYRGHSINKVKASIQDCEKKCGTGLCLLTHKKKWEMTDCYRRVHQDMCSFLGTMMEQKDHNVHTESAQKCLHNRRSGFVVIDYTGKCGGGVWCTHPDEGNDEKADERNSERSYGKETKENEKVSNRDDLDDSQIELAVFDPHLDEDSEGKMETDRRRRSFVVQKLSLTKSSVETCHKCKSGRNKGLCLLTNAHNRNRTDCFEGHLHDGLCDLINKMMFRKDSETKDSSVQSCLNHRGYVAIDYRQSCGGGVYCTHHEFDS